MNKIVGTLLVAVFLAMSVSTAFAAVTMNNYTAYPPFINQTVPPLVMIAMSKDHRQFIMAYNDISDLNGDGSIETTYTDTINYYGYFDSQKCYTYTSSRFVPAGAATGTNNHYCTSQWSGNFLNWATMTRMDVTRKVLYGGFRVTSLDTSGASATTVLRRTWLPQDAHSFAKAYTGSDLSSLVPTTGLGLVSGAVTLCNTNTTDYTAGAGGTVLVFDGNYPYAGSTESSAGGIHGQCTRTQNASTTAITVKATLKVDVQVCMPTLLESNCETYQDSAAVNTWYKPSGLMQRMGVNRQGTPANISDDRILMQFALISGSYGAHVGGGVLRSNTTNINNERDPQTGVVLASSKIMNTINNFVMKQYQYSSGWYNGNGTAGESNCNQGEPLTLSDTNGYCRSWGNPLSEMFFEAIRYVKGLSAPTAPFQPASPDANVTGLSVESSWIDPYTVCAYCAKPFVLLFSDASPSYDSDHLPGPYSGWAVPPDPINTGSDTPAMTTLMANSQINTLEGITGTNVFIGESGMTNDKACSPKSADFSQMRGLCTEEPTKRGSFYLAGLANYAKRTDLRGSFPQDPTNAVTQNITTYSVVTNSPFPTLQFTVGTNTVQIVPDFFDGCPKVNWGSPGYAGCTTIGTNGDSSKGELVYLKLCPNDADWTTEQGNGFTSCYEIMWDDAEHGWDYDLDVLYRIYVQTNAGANTITLKTKGLYGAAGHTDYAGYFINGVSGSGSYLDLVCGGVASFTDCDTYNNITAVNDGMGNSVSQRTFSVTGATTQILKDPLWYAAKYGGFKDSNNNGVPNLPGEWDANGDGVPDTYFKAVSPLYLEQNLAAAFAAILNQASSGTAASVLASSTTGDGTLYQSYFFPSRLDGELEIKYVGYTQGLFVDKYGNLREDTNSDGALTFNQDRIVVTRYDLTQKNTVADLYVDLNGDGLADTPQIPTTVPLDQLKPIWEAGRRLAININKYGPAVRKILTWVDNNLDYRVDGGTDNGVHTNITAGEVITFDTSNLTVLSPYLRPDTTAPYTDVNIINFTRGAQIANLRNRQLTVTPDTGPPTKMVWALGDSVYATPVIVGNPRERYDVLYGDQGYSSYFQRWQGRRQVAYVGANDGMLHAFNVGFFTPGNGITTPTISFTTGPLKDGRTPKLGDENWAFIPQELLPHLRWLADPGYTHVYYVDLKPKITDARIFTQEAACVGSPTASGCIHPGGWGTILIGGFRMGGSCGNCSPTGNGAPMVVKANFDGSGNLSTPGNNRTFLSGYFVLDITDPDADPKLLWSFSDTNLGLATSYPAVARVVPSSTTGRTDPTGEKWVVIFGSGPTSYDASTGQNGKMFIVDLKAGPSSGQVVAPATAPQQNDRVNYIDATANTADGVFKAFMGDLITVDQNLDFRVDAVYGGQVINDTRGGGIKPWRGLLVRLTTGCQAGSCQTNPSIWGLTGSGSNVPTYVVDKFNDAGNVSQTLGPIATAPSAVVDMQNNLWLFAGTGRFYNVGTSSDQTDTTTQYLIGVKDRLFSGTCTSETNQTNCEAPLTPKVLVDVSTATICVLGTSGCTSTTQVSSVPQLGGSGVSSYTSLISLVQ
jgi:type IV pilus assembly protein PilY1